MLLHSIHSEWLKTRKSAASWLCLTGSLFLPLMFLIGFLKDHTSINAYGHESNIWKIYFFQIWKFMAIALLPIGVILSSSLITQLEYANNGWKQLHSTPQHFSTIFLAKLSGIVLMTLKFFMYFTAGLLISATIPCLLFDHQWPREKLPLKFLLEANTKIFITCLPVIAIQYLISLRFRNFLVPIGAGILGLVGSLILIKTWKYAYLSPFSYTPMIFIGDKDMLLRVNIFLLSGIYFFALTLISYILYLTAKEKG